MTDTSLGAILVNMGIVSQQQLDEALQIQAQTMMKAPIGATLIALSYCDVEDIEQATRIQPGLRSENLADRATATATLAAGIKRGKALASRRMAAVGKEISIKIEEWLLSPPLAVAKR